MNRRSDGVSLTDAKLDPRNCQREEKWQREREVRLGKKWQMLLSAHKGSSKPFFWASKVLNTPN